MKISILTCLFAIFFSTSTYSQEFEHKCYETINCADFKLFMEEKEVVVVDARLYKDYRAERIRNASMAASREALHLLLEKTDTNTYILVYCKDGTRSKTACEIIGHELNFKQVFNLDKGIKEWKKKGYLTDKSQIKKSEH